MMDVNSTCPRPVASATGPSVRMRWRSSLRPTTNKSSEMPSLGKEVELIGGRDPAQAGRPDQYTGCDERHDEGLPEKDADSTERSRDGEHRGDLVEHAAEWLHGRRTFVTVSWTEPLGRPMSQAI